MDFYFDYISPYAYIGWTQIHALAEKHGRSVSPIPVLFAAMLNESGRLGPAETPLMRRWVGLNILRKAHELNVPLHTPATHPFNPLLALRVTVLDMSDAQQFQLIGHLFEAVWVKGQDVTDPMIVGALLQEIGLDPNDGLAQVQQPKIKNRVKQNTAQAIERGAFGVPTVVVDGELFWGHDDFRYLERFLQGVDHYSRDEFDAWMAVRASATRR
ncbi:2-hydroxychromene-2-carboxylate isomerase [Chloroflexi bacterium TSY]|nr:2-hydroxychromene-2-carboxylate isomerase [Chloroflexi bacterium TSY]